MRCAMMGVPKEDTADLPKEIPENQKKNRKQTGGRGGKR